MKLKTLKDLLKEVNLKLKEKNIMDNLKKNLKEQKTLNSYAEIYYLCIDFNSNISLKYAFCKCEYDNLINIDLIDNYFIPEFLISYQNFKVLNKIIDTFDKSYNDKEIELEVINDYEKCNNNDVLHLKIANKKYYHNSYIIIEKKIENVDENNIIIEKKIENN